MMPFTLESNRKKAMSQVKQPTRNWLDLPSELMANILHRIGVFDILLSVQKVCTTWRKICNDPAMWKVVCIDAMSDPHADVQLDQMCKHVVDRSQGQLVDITIVQFGYDEIFRYIANRSSQLKRLTIACGDGYINGECLKKLPLLEELSIYQTFTSKEAIETAGRYCSMLKTLKLNQEDFRCWNGYGAGEFITIHNDDKVFIGDGIAMAIGLNLHDLRHLELIGNPMSNKGLEMILDGCRHLESLDLRACLFIDLKGDLGKRCSQQVKCLKLPNDSLEGCPYIYKNNDMTFDDDDDGFEGGFESDIESYEEFYDEVDGESDIRSDEEFVDESDIESNEEFDDE